MVVEPIQIEGLDEFGKSVAKIDRGLAKTIRVILNEAVEGVADEARHKVPKRSGRAARTVKAASTRKEGRVSGGGNRAPYYPWLDFGGSVGPRGATKRRYLKEGRYIFKVYGKHRDSGDFTKMLDEGLKDLGRQAGIVIESGE